MNVCIAGLVNGELLSYTGECFIVDLVNGELLSYTYGGGGGGWGDGGYHHIQKNACVVDLVNGE